MSERRQKMPEPVSNIGDKFICDFADTLSDAIISADADGNIIFLNRAAVEMFGYATTEIIGRQIVTLIPECIKTKHSKSWERWRMNGRLASDGKRIIQTALRKNGEEFPVELKISTSYIHTLRYVTTTTVRDVSEQIADEKTLRLLEAAFNSAAHATVITDTEGLIVWVNPAFTTNTGYTAEEALGKKTSLLKSGQQDERFYKELWETVIAGKTWHGTLINRRKNGSHYSEQMSITSVRDNSGKISHFIAVKQDITETVRMRKLLQKNVDRYRRLFENSPLALWEEDYSAVKICLDELKKSGVTDFQAYFTEHPETVRLCAAMIQVVDVNAAAVKLIAAENKAALIGDLNKNFRKSSYDDLKDQLVWLAAGHLSYKAEITNKSCSGELLHVDLHLSIADEFSSCWSEVIVSLEDITDRKQREKQLAHTTKMEAVGKLTGGIAHDFNNVLTVISGNLRLITEIFGQELNADARDMVSDALSAADDGAQLTSRLLTFSRKPAPDRSLIDMNKLVTDCVVLMRRTIGNGIEFDIRLSDSPVKAHTDWSALSGILLNLSINACDAMPEGGRLTFTTRMASNEPGVPSDSALTESVPGVIIEVADTGCGMSADVLARATEPFFTTKDIDAGSGLGLSMAYDFMRECGGDLQISSTPGSGTRVVLHLPVEPCCRHQ